MVWEAAIHGRLLDHDEKVRSEAVKVMCDLAKSNLNLVSSDLISGASERLRDKKVTFALRFLMIQSANLLCLFT